MNFQKIKKFITTLSLSFFVLFLFSLLLSLFNLNIGIENNRLITYLLLISFLLLAFHFKEIIEPLRIKSSQRKNWKSKITINIKNQKNKFAIFFEKNWVKWGLIPILLLLFGLGLTIAGTFSSNEAFSVLVKNHSRQELNLFPSKKLLPGQRIQGKFKSVGDNLGIVSIRFDTSEREDNETINFRLKERGAGDWYYENIYTTEQFQNDEFFPFGFPEIENSRNKTYVFEIEPQENTEGFLQISSTKPVFESRYKVGEGPITQNILLLANCLYAKLSFSFQNNPILFTFLLLFIPVSYLLSYLFYSPKEGEEFASFFIKNLFLLFLIIYSITTFNFDYFHPLKDIFLYCVIAVGAVVFWQNKDKVSKETDIRQKEEKYDKLINIVGFLIIFIVFIYFRSLSFGNSPIEMANYDKARSDLPCAINAFFQKDFFHYRNYFYNGIENNNSLPYSRLPFYTWLFYPFLYLKDFLSFDVLMKTFLTLLDSFILIIFYKIVLKLFGNLVGFITTLLFAVNSYFQFYFLPPVLDRPGLLFFLLSILANLNKKTTLGYFLAGFSGLAKESFFLISLPFHFALILFRRISVKNKVLELIRLLFFLLTPYTLFKFLGPKMSTSSQPLLYFSLFWGLLVSLFLLDKKFSPSIKKFLKNKKTGKWCYIISIITVCVLGIFLWDKGANLSNNFLTDSKIIFKWRMYYSILKQQEDFLPKIFWYISFIGIALSLPIFSKINKTSLALGVSSLTYLIIASKSVFFHGYYRHIFVIYMIFLFGVVLLKIKSLFDKKIIKFFVVFLISFSVIIPTVNMTKKYLNKIRKSDSTKGYRQLAEYVRKETDSDEKLLTNSVEAYFGATLYASRFPANFENKKNLRREIQKNGFIATMKKYNVSMYVSKGPSDFENLLTLFINLYRANNITRTEHILLRINDENWEKYTPGENHDLRSEYNTTEYLNNKEEVISYYNPGQYFRLEKIIGDFYIYRLNEENYLPESSF